MLQKRLFSFETSVSSGRLIKRQLAEEPYDYLIKGTQLFKSRGREGMMVLADGTCTQGIVCCPGRIWIRRDVG